ncbi:MAG: DUF6809 family protein [Oscillospiraceae bacterium]
MKSAIEQMCSGLRGTYESVQPTDKQSEIMSKVCEADTKLTAMLKSNIEATELYNQFKNAIEEANSEECETFYKEGFRFGVLMGIDIINEK